MIHYNIYFKPYDWEVEVYVALNNCYISKIIDSMRNCPQSEIQSAFLNLTTRVDSGFIRTFDRKSIIAGTRNATIPTDANLVTSIDIEAFYGVTMTSLVVPANITTLIDMALGVSGVNVISFKSITPPSNLSVAFNGSSVTTILVPTGAKSAYEGALSQNTRITVVEDPSLD